MLIDCHVHLNNYYTENGDNRRPTEENVERLWDAMAANGVDHAVVLTSYKVNVDRPSVEHVLEILAEDPRTTVVEGLRWRGDERTEGRGAEHVADLLARESQIGHVSRDQHGPRHEKPIRIGAGLIHLTVNREQHADEECGREQRTAPGRAIDAPPRGHGDGRNDAALDQAELRKLVQPGPVVGKERRDACEHGHDAEGQQQSVGAASPRARIRRQTCDLERA